MHRSWSEHPVAVAEQLRAIGGRSSGVARTAGGEIIVVVRLLLDLDRGELSDLGWRGFALLPTGAVEREGRESDIVEVLDWEEALMIPGVAEGLLAHDRGRLVRALRQSPGLQLEGRVAAALLAGASGRDERLELLRLLGGPERRRRGRGGAR